MFLRDPRSPTVVPDTSIVNNELFFATSVVEEVWKLQGDVERRLIELGTPAALALADREPEPNPRVFKRGSPSRLGEEVPRQFLEVISGPKRQPFKEGSGRLELARAIASADNPLTARVMVNRIWQHHFGAGLVRTPSDYGLRAEPPSHPELLDWLAIEFMNQGWSMKKLHRLIVTSQTYRQSSAGGELMATDPENRLLGRMSRKRLSFEGLRDGLLLAADRLDPAVGGRSVDLFKAPYTTRRSVYGFIDRQDLPNLFRVFDIASPDQSSPRRPRTTVPQQALFLMNSPFVVEQAQSLAARPEVAAAESDDAKIAALYRLVLTRQPDTDELVIGRQFVATVATNEETKMSVWEQYAQLLLLTNEVMYVD